MQIESISATPGVTGFYADDQRAIADGASQDGFVYEGDPVTEGFDRIRQPGESLIVTIDLSDGDAVRGDCAAVQYSGAGGRDPLFRATDHVSTVEGPIQDALSGHSADAFAENAATIEELSVDGDRLHTAIRYGISQALLAAAARARRTTMTDVVADAIDATPATRPIPVFGQSGDERYENAEKMLLSRVPVLPHGLFNSVEKVGTDGDRLRQYLEWLSDRTAELGGREYEPTFHVDVYGTIGTLFDPPYDRPAVVEYVAELAAAAAPYSLQIEGPVDAGDREAQLAAMGELRDGLADAGVDVDIVADEWCNTLDDVQAFVDAGAADVVQVKTPDLGGLQRSAAAVRYCEGTETRAYLGGTCNETATSARATAHVALATKAAQVLAKPGMGFDEGHMIVENEMRRTVDRRRRRTTDASQTDVAGRGGDAR
ncbi:methylaspartate ammonia-lyase [Halovivax cerinus]|uniref:methylaspartate ammonia-lyase n=1 Tax=Halovivax cerinus TaxID=1487865 RepID=A0ABD5NMK7_9EURY|nr:methylaspartate ammonia-lyase [Halovivax cerinus]